MDFARRRRKSKVLQKKYGRRARIYRAFVVQNQKSQKQRKLLISRTRDTLRKSAASMMRLNELSRWGHALLQPVILIGAMTLAVTVLALDHLTIKQEGQDYQRALMVGANMSLMLERQVSDKIRQVDNELLLLRALYQDDPVKFNLERWVHDDGLRKEINFNVSIVGADGFLKSNGFGPVDRSNYLGDLKPFIAHAYSMTDKLYVGRPVRSKVTGKWSIQLSRRIIEPDGSLGGIIIATLDPRGLIPKWIRAWPRRRSYDRGL